MLPTPGTPLLSISLDLAGSTEAKAAILRVSAGDTDNVAECYASLFRQFFHHEADFYLGLLSGGIPAEDIFLVKTIGDEIWAVVTCPRDEIGRRAVATIRAGLATVGKSARVVCYERRLTEEEELTEPDSLGLACERRQLGIKGFVDLIEKPYEINALRQEAFLKSLGDFARAGSGAQAALERLGGFSLSMIGGTRASVSHRTDFIGFEVDRFFRCTKFAKEGELRIGRTLADALPLTSGQGLPSCDDGPRDVTFSVPEKVMHSVRLTRECLREDDLKGLGRGYSVFRVEDECVPQGFCAA